jgi:hypothetical protein
MCARLELGLAAALLMAAAGHAGADPYKPSVVGPAPTSSDYSAAESPTERSSEADAYNRAAINDPYRQPDFSAQQSYGLTASQMLGAAAACEQLHSDLVNGRRTKASKDSSDEARASLDAAQQHMLDPAATSDAGEVDCDRVSGSFSQLQQIQIRDQDLAKALDQADAVSPSPNANTGARGAAAASSSAVRSLQPR